MAIGTIGIFGAGNIGGNLARLFAKAGETVLISGASGPQKTAAKFADAPQVKAAAAQEVADAQTVVIAIPWSRLAELAPIKNQLVGKIVLDVTNPYKADFSGLEDLHGRRSSAVVADLFPGARIVKAVNTLHYPHLVNGARPKGATDRIALPVAGDDPSAKQAVIALFDRAGFSGIDAGSIAQSGAQEPDGPLYNRAMTEAALIEALASLHATTK